MLTNNKLRSVSETPKYAAWPLKRRNMKNRFNQRFVTQHDQNSAGKKGNQTTYALSRGRIDPNYVMIEPEELAEQNIQLKKNINLLHKELDIHKGKIQLQKRKTYKYTKQLQRESSSKTFWISAGGNNEKLIAGIKYQYQKLKKQHQEKLKQLDQIKLHEIYTRNQQLETELEIVTEQCQQLYSQLKKYIGEEEDKRNGDNYFRKPISYKNDSGISLMEKENQAIRFQLEDCKRKLRKLESKDYENSKKMEFLQSQQIAVRNSEFHAKKNQKKLRKQHIELLNQLEQQKKQHTRYVNKNQQKIKNQKEQIQRTIAAEKAVFEKLLSESEQQIRQLQKEVSYLNSLLSYWKPLDHEGGQDIPLEMLHKKTQQSQQLFFMNKQHGMQNREPRTPMASQNGSYSFEQYRFNTQQFLKPGQNVSIDDKNSSNPPKSNRSNQQIDNMNKTVKNSYVNHSSNGIKKRKVQKGQTEDITEEIRYKLIGAKLSIQQAKNLFSYFPSGATQNAKWKEKYISMSEVQIILKQKPFSLSEQQSFLISRYIIEDCPNDFVYCDLQNQMQRSIVKSILKAMIQTYQVPQESDMQNEWNDLMKKGGKNLRLALNSISSKGIISLADFKELIQSLSIEISQLCLDWCIAKLLKNSESLTKLKFNCLFQEDQYE